VAEKSHAARTYMRRCKIDDEISWSNARHLPDAMLKEMLGEVPMKVRPL
jgi:hypothetical protein